MGEGTNAKQGEGLLPVEGKVCREGKKVCWGLLGASSNIVEVKQNQERRDPKVNRHSGECSISWRPHQRAERRFPGWQLQ